VGALLGEQTRPHADLDILIPSDDAVELVRALREHGFEDVPTDDRVDENFVMGQTERGLVDFHVFEISADGSGVYKPGVADWLISAEELGARGLVGGRPVRCLTPGYQVRSHSGYRLATTDAHDLSMLRERFGIALTNEQEEAIAALVSSGPSAASPQVPPPKPTSDGMPD
jgi:lincosamide nucleotidyltransferase A/C/D/E